MALLWNPDSWTQRLADLVTGLRSQLAALTAEWEELMMQLDAEAMLSR